MNTVTAYGRASQLASIMTTLRVYVNTAALCASLLVVVNWTSGKILL